MLETKLSSRTGVSDGNETEQGADNRKFAIVTEKLSVDDMLQRWVGEFGWAQLWHFVLVSLAWTVEALHTLVMIFADREPSWRCRTPSSVSLSTTSPGGMGLSLHEESLQCTPASSLCEMDPSLWEWVEGVGASTISEWGLICGDEYKVGLAQAIFFIGGLCGAGVFGNLSDSILGRKGVLLLACTMTAVAGLLTSLAPNYWIYVFMRGLTGVSCGGVGLSCFVLATEPVGPSKRGQVGMSAFYFFSFGIMTLPAFAYFTPSWRILYATTAIPAILYCLLVLPFVWESPRWYLVQGRLQEAMVILRAFARGNDKFIPESVWLATEDEEAEEAVTGYLSSSLENPEHLERNTNPEFGDIKEEKVMDLVPPHPSAMAGQKAPGNLFDVFRFPATRSRMLIMIVVWFNCAIVYYGINLNVVNLGFNLYLSVFFNGLVEMPAFAITALLLGRLGRRFMLVSAMLLSGIACLIGSFLSLTPSESTPGLLNLSSQQYGSLSGLLDLKWGNASQTVPGFQSLRSSFSLPGILPPHTASAVGMVGTSAGLVNVVAALRALCSVVAIFGMAGTYNLTYIYTSELFPTVVRNAALGLTTQSAGIGSIIAPVIVVLGHLHPSLPFAVFGVAAVLGGLLAIKLPETLNQPLWETLEGLERGEKAREASQTNANALSDVESQSTQAEEP